MVFARLVFLSSADGQDGGRRRRAARKAKRPRTKGPRTKGPKRALPKFAKKPNLAG
jgi:hypothetical protein